MTMFIINTSYWFLEVFLGACLCRVVLLLLSKKKGDNFANAHNFMVRHMKCFTGLSEKMLEKHAPKMTCLALPLTAVGMSVLVNSLIMTMSFFM